MHHISSVFAFLCISISLLAQTPVQLDSIFISELKINSLSSKTGKSMTVLTGEEIESLPVSALDELLRYLPGVNVNSRGPFGVQTDIGLRGSTFSQVLVMLDNIRINDPLTGHFNNNIPVAIAEIHHIEVIRGIAAVAYGSDAVGGLIHIKTKSYEAASHKKTSALSGEVAVGENNLLLSDIGFNFNNNSVFGSASIKTNISDGESLVNPNYSAGISDDSLYNNYFDLRTYSASLGYHFSKKLKIFSRFGYDVRDFKAKYFYTASAYDESEEQTSSYWNQLALHYNNKRNKVEFDAAFKRATDVFTFNPLFAINEHETDQLILNYNHEYRINEKHSTAFGAQMIQKQIVSSDRGNHENQTLAVYGLISSRFLSNFKSIASIRAVQDENFGFELLPQVSLSYHPNNFVLKSSIGRAIRAADFTERFVSSQIGDLSPGRNVGNPDLKAEISNSIDLGCNLYLEKGLSLSSSIFYRRSENLIDFAPTNSDNITNVSNLQAGEIYYFASNIAKSETYGLEILANKLYSFNPNYRLHFLGSYTWLNTSGIENELSKYVANHPTHNFSAILDLDIYRFKIASTNSFIVRQAENIIGINGVIPDAYFISNLKLSLKANQSISFFTQVQNLSDTQYQEILGAKMPSRWFLGGLKWSL